MTTSINFHRRTGLKPSVGLYAERYGSGTVLILRVWWSALTLTVIHGSLVG